MKVPGKCILLPKSSTEFGMLYSSYFLLCLSVSPHLSSLLIALGGDATQITPIRHFCLLVTTWFNQLGA